MVELIDFTDLRTQTIRPQTWYIWPNQQYQPRWGPRIAGYTSTYNTRTVNYCYHLITQRVFQPKTSSSPFQVRYIEPNSVHYAYYKFCHLLDHLAEDFINIRAIAVNQDLGYNFQTQLLKLLQQQYQYNNDFRISIKNTPSYN